MQISIALCTYNGEAFLAEQLNSILQQTLSPSQVVICDDGSTDSTAQIAQAFAASAPFEVSCRVNVQRLGVTANFNCAIQHCRGDMIALADQDDVWLPHKLATIADTFAQKPTLGYVFSDAALINGNGQPLNRRLWQETGFSAARQYLFQTDPITTLLRRNVVTGATMAFRAPIINALPMPSPTSIHDFWWAFFASILGHTGYAITTPLMKYRIHAAQKIGLSGLNLPEFQRYQREIAAMNDLSRDVAQAARQFPHQQNKFDHVIHLIHARRDHFQCRMNIRSARGINRLKLWLTEVQTGRYAVFSHSWRGALKDLVVTNDG
ncbi:MAG: glycosyltransferase family 2 protein [Anaerolineae bacterium]|nr:glycosyltransferase family 2 protein [Anaerolineae bacterium]